MAYIPKNKLEKLTTTGGELVYKTTRQDYIGPYVKTSTNKYYEGDDITSLGKELEVTIAETNNIATSTNGTKFTILQKSTYQSLKNHKNVPGSKNIPTEEDYSRGYFSRYFLIRSNGGGYKEIKNKTYQDYKSKAFVDKNLYSIGNIKWALTKDVVKTNKLNVKLTERKYPGIHKIFPILNEFEKIKNYNIIGRSYPDFEEIPPLLPPTYDLPKIANRNCGNCSLAKLEHCHKWKANIRSNYWCASWEATTSSNIFSDIDTPDLDISENIEHKRYTATRECEEMASRGRFPSKQAKEDFISNCVSTKLSPARGGGY